MEAPPKQYSKGVEYLWAILAITSICLIIITVGLMFGTWKYHKFNEDSIICLVSGGLGTILFMTLWMVWLSKRKKFGLYSSNVGYY